MLVHNLSMRGAPIAEVIGVLRHEVHAPVSFIESKGDERIDLDLTNSTVKEVLNQIVSRSKGYRSLEISGRLVLLPDTPVFAAPVAGVDIQNQPRLQAADRYVDFLKTHVKGLEDLAGTVVKGDPNLPIFTERVSVSPDTTVLGGLMDLLGHDPAACFSILRSKSGKYVFVLESVPQPE